MNERNRITLAMLSFLIAVMAMWFVPAEAVAKVYFYTLTRNGTLVRYDPDTDRVELKGDVGGPYVTVEADDDPSLRAPTRVLDMKRQQIVTLDADETGVHAVQLDIRTGTAKKIAVAPGLGGNDILHFIYPRNASRFYIRWLRRKPTPPFDFMVTTVGMDGQVIGSSVGPFPTVIAPVYHPNGRDFYVADPGREVVLYHGDTLAVLGRYDLTPLVRPEFLGPGPADLRDGRVLLASAPRADMKRPATVFTTDLTFSSQSATPRIATGLSREVLLLVEGGRTVLLQEARESGGGLGRLHFFDVTTGAKVGVVNLNTTTRADLLGLHPDGRRLFIRTFKVDPTVRGLDVRLMIVDVISRTVLRDRPFEDIGFASDFVDEPQ